MKKSLFYNEIADVMQILKMVGGQKDKTSLILLDDFALSTNSLNNLSLHQTLNQVLSDKSELTQISEKYVSKTLSFVSIKNP